MTDIRKRDQSNITRGSLADVARSQGQTLAEAFLSCDAVVIVDTSASMNVCDVGEDRTRSRYLAACDELRRLQESMPGKVAVVSFSGSTEFCPGGIPRYIGSTTAMQDALAFVKIADGTGIKLILISDGEPNSPSETLRVARTFTTKIDTVFIGQPGSPGAEFLKQLSAATGGIATTQKTSELHKLGSTVRLMIGKA